MLEFYESNLRWRSIEDKDSPWGSLICVQGWSAFSGLLSTHFSKNFHIVSFLGLDKRISTEWFILSWYFRPLNFTTILISMPPFFPPHAHVTLAIRDNTMLPFEGLRHSVVQRWFNKSVFQRCSSIVKRFWIRMQKVPKYNMTVKSPTWRHNTTD